MYLYNRLQSQMYGIGVNTFLKKKFVKKTTKTLERQKRKMIPQSSQGISLSFGD